MDTDENGITNGVKISMFDISDPSDVKEVSKYTLDQYYYSDVFSDYRAALVDPEKESDRLSAFRICQPVCDPFLR